MARASQARGGPSGGSHEAVDFFIAKNDGILKACHCGQKASFRRQTC